MSLWTPGGEHEVPRGGDGDPSGAPPEPQGTPPPAPGGFPGGIDPSELSDEEREQLEAAAAEMAEVQRRVAAAPASDVIANHVMGFYELAAIHLSQQPPNLPQATVAIDAMRAVIENLVGRLGEAETTLKEALGQVQMAFVQLSESSESQAPEGGQEPSGADEA
jgi:hypothetical protein